MSVFWDDLTQDLKEPEFRREFETTAMELHSPQRFPRLLWTGSRTWGDWGAIDRIATEELHRYPAGTTVIMVHGDYRNERWGKPPGLDAIIDSWANSKIIAARHPEYTIIAEPHPADWFRDCDENCQHRPRRRGERCPAAGPLRNQHTVDLGADKCIAAPTEGSRGTWDCVRRAKAAGIPVRVVS